MGCIAVRSSVVVRRAAVVIAAVEACLQVCMDRRTPEHWAAAVAAAVTAAAADRLEQGSKVMQIQLVQVQQPDKVQLGPQLVVSAAEPKELRDVGRQPVFEPGYTKTCGSPLIALPKRT